MTWIFFVVAGGIAIGITTSAVLALYWASRNDQLKDLDKGAETIFDEDEPLGEPTDFFPGEKPEDTENLPNRK